MSIFQNFETQMQRPVNIRRMAELAKAENAKANFKDNNQQKKRGPIQNHEVLEELANRPDGAIIPEIAEAIHRHPQSVANCCKRLVDKGVITSTQHRANNNRVVPLYRIAQ